MKPGIMPAVLVGCLLLAQASRSETCENCFAVVVVPDTQYYTGQGGFQPGGKNHLQWMMNYICAHKSAWTEVRTQKEMPILMVLHVGDLIENAGTAQSPGQWAIIDSAFDILDECTPQVPYLVVPGNHDLGNPGRQPATPDSYSVSAAGFNEHFAAPCVNPSELLCDANGGPGSEPHPPRKAWRDGACRTAPDCAYPGEWYLGNGDDVRKASRDLDGVSGLAAASAGPPASEPGRHRAGVIRTPQGTQMLLVGLDYGFDWDVGGDHGDDLEWVEGLLRKFPTTPTILVHHQLFLEGHLGGKGLLYTDSARGSPQAAANAAWNKLVVPNRQIMMTLNGHWVPGRVTASIHKVANQHKTSIPGQPGRFVYRIYRNFQAVTDPNYANGWISFLVFDPDMGQIRLRSHKIESPEGTPAIVDNDYSCPVDPMGCEYIENWSFPKPN